MQVCLLRTVNLLLRHVGSDDGVSFVHEILDDYVSDASHYLLDPRRLLGFAHGLMAAGVITPEAYDDIDVEIVRLTGGSLYEGS